MSLPGDKRIDTDPKDKPPARIQQIRDAREQLEKRFNDIHAASKVLNDESASADAKRLAKRVLENQPLHALLDQIWEKSLALHEDLKTLEETRQ